MNAQRIARLLYRTLLVISTVFILLVGLVFVAFTTPYDLIGLTDTEYTPGYSRARFREISAGDPASKVLRLLGEPFERYRDWNERRWIWQNTGVEVVFDNTKVISVHDPRINPGKTIEIGMPHSQVWDTLGTANRNEGVAWDREFWSYSRSPGSTNYWLVSVEVEAGTQTVVRRNERFYFD